MSGATISLTNSSQTKGDISDFEGNFDITLTKAGTYEMNIRFLGFKTYSETLLIGDQAAVDLGPIKLKEDDLQLQAVELIGRARTDYNSDYSFSATKVAILNKELPQAISSVTK